MDLSVCIASFNTRDVLAQTLAAVLADGSGLSVEIIVVDNGSADGSDQMVRTQFPLVRLIANRDNRFFAAANNQAMARASGRYVLALNSDVNVLPGTLPRLVGYLDSHLDIGAVTTRLYFPDGRLQRTCAKFWTYERLLLEFSFLRWLLRPRRIRLARWASYSDWDRSGDRPVEVAPGSFLMARTRLLASVGGYDERLRQYFTDDDWCLRLHQSGHKLMYVGAAGAIHPEGVSTRRIRSLARRIFFEDMLAYAAKHFGPRRARWLSALTRPTQAAMAFASRWQGG